MKPHTVVLIGAFLAFVTYQVLPRCKWCSWSKSNGLPFCKGCGKDL